MSLRLNEAHESWLRERGIPEEYYSYLVDAKLLKSTADGLAIFYPDERGDPTDIHRIKLDKEVDGQKYTQPSGTTSKLYFCPFGHHRDVKRPLMLVEGELKALSLQWRLKRRAQVVGIGGIWNWQAGKDKKGGRILIDCFRRLKLKGRKVYIVFDSDVAGRLDLETAEASFARSLRVKGAIVRIAILPQGKKGIDDWLVAWGESWEAELTSILRRAVAYRGVFEMEDEYAQVYSFDEMLTKKFASPRFYVGDDSFGLVAEGMVTFIHGGTNLGKTYLANQIAVCIATGSRFLDSKGRKGFPTSKARVLYFQGELPPGLFARHRIEPLKKKFPNPDILYFNWSFDLGESSRFKEAFGHDSWVGFNRLEDMIANHAPKVVVMDPLQSYHNLVESNNDQQRELMKRIKRIAMNYRIGFVVVDHDRKDADGVQALRGGAAKGDLSDTVIGLRPDEESTKFIWLAWDKVRYISTAKPQPFRARINEDMIFERF